MDHTLHQLGELLLGSVPTVILLATLYILYTFLVHRPLGAVLAERRNRTQGAMERLAPTSPPPKPVPVNMSSASVKRARKFSKIRKPAVSNPRNCATRS